VVVHEAVVHPCLLGEPARADARVADADEQPLRRVEERFFGGRASGRLVRGLPHPVTMTTSEAPMRSTPSGALSRRPQETFFSTAITAASASIHARFPTPTTTINSISDQQQPTQNTP